MDLSFGRMKTFVGGEFVRCMAVRLAELAAVRLLDKL